MNNKFLTNQETHSKYNDFKIKVALNNSKNNNDFTFLRKILNDISRTSIFNLEICFASYFFYMTVKHNFNNFENPDIKNILTGSSGNFYRRMLKVYLFPHFKNKILDFFVEYPDSFDLLINGISLVNNDDFAIDLLNIVKDNSTDPVQINRAIEAYHNLNINKRKRCD